MAVWVVWSEIWTTFVWFCIFGVGVYIEASSKVSGHCYIAILPYCHSRSLCAVYTVNYTLYQPGS
jgi:hypothetical protein